MEHFGVLDAAVANAGFTSVDSFRTGGATISHPDGDPSLRLAMVLTNVMGPALPARATLPHLQDSRGRLVIIGSFAGLKNAPGNLYSATKWAVTALAENVRLHATTVGVGVTLIAPGMIDTSLRAAGTQPSFAMPAQPLAEAIGYVLDQPAGVDLNTLTIRPIGQPV